MRWALASVLVHALVIVLLVGTRDAPRVPVATPDPVPVAVDAPTEVTFVDEPAVKGGGGAAQPAARRTSAVPRRSVDAWEQTSMRIDSSAGSRGGEGTGIGTGTGRGIGFGDGGGVRVADEVPAPPPPPEVSKARPAKLIWPTRDEEVDDETALFVARVTVDEEGDVVGARMVTTRPGARADRAASAIWTFRYAPALDDRGRPTRSTFDQSFQVR